MFPFTQPFACRNLKRGTSQSPSVHTIVRVHIYIYICSFVGIYKGLEVLTRSSMTERRVQCPAPLYHFNGANRRWQQQTVTSSVSDTHETSSRTLYSIRICTLLPHTRSFFFYEKKVSLRFSYHTVKIF